MALLERETIDGDELKALGSGEDSPSGEGSGEQASTEEEQTSEAEETEA